MLFFLALLFSLTRQRNIGSASRSYEDAAVATADVAYSPLLVSRAFARRIIARECGAEAEFALLPMDAPPRALLAAISETCADATSFLPFAGREVWHRHADVAVLDTDMAGMSTEETTKMTLSRLAKCAARGGGGGGRSGMRRACIVFLHSYVLPHTADALLAYLRDHPLERFVLVTSSNDDGCLPWFGSAREGSPPALAALLVHERVGAWFGENPCPGSFPGSEKLHPLPLGPKFRTSRAFGGENVGGVRARLHALIAAAEAVEPKERRGMFLRVSVNSTAEPLVANYTGLRSKTLPHMLKLAAALESELAHAGAAADRAAIVSADDYLAELLQSRFAWSPPGRGIDAHRTWECLLAGTLPIVLRSSISAAYAGLPVIEVDSFEALSIGKLKAAAAQLNRLGLSGAVELSPQLFAFHWLSLIEDAARRFQIL